ncbi:hypothetical protein [Oceaniglobus trochenteri]|uniref:hypothetical protein n=1 Tax=Oceaniglobus trochenteri TaxID=2763260 RepID=UPI001CFF8F95|nr:hypothetical protein [Oceaniglobus trochenteri]
MKKSIAPVSDHAVLRYLERVKGLDVEAVRREIGHLVDIHLDHPGASGVINGGFSYRIRGGVVTTVIRIHSCDPRTGGHRRERPE